MEKGSSNSFSEKITSGRFIMMMGVVIMHCNVIGLPGYDGPSTMTHCIQLLMSSLFSVRVPWFFFISAYLMGYRHPSINRETYKSLIYKRTKTILIPYLLWNAIAFLIREGVSFSPLGSYTQGGRQYDSFIGLLTYVFINPELEPLWFLRNLFLFALLCPLIQRLVRFNAVIALALLWVVDHYTFTGDIMFYGFGLICADRYSPERISDWLPKFALLLPVTGLLMYVEVTYFGYIPIIKEILVACGMFGIWGLTCILIPSPGQIGRPDILFFIYGFHGIISPYILKVFTLIIHFSGYYWLALFIGTVLIVIAISYGGAKITKTISPRFYAILTGSRHKKIDPL